MKVKITNKSAVNSVRLPDGTIILPSGNTTLDFDDALSNVFLYDGVMVGWGTKFSKSYSMAKLLKALSLAGAVDLAGAEVAEVDPVYMMTCPVDVADAATVKWFTPFDIEVVGFACIVVTQATADFTLKLTDGTHDVATLVAKSTDPAGTIVDTSTIAPTYKNFSKFTNLVFTGTEAGAGTGVVTAMVLYKKRYTI